MHMYIHKGVLDQIVDMMWCVCVRERHGHVHVCEGDRHGHMHVCEGERHAQHVRV